MKLLETVEVIGLAHWAPALFYGDESGMDDTDIEEMNDWLIHEVSVVTPYAPIDMRREDNGIAGDAATYIFPVYGEDQ